VSRCLLWEVKRPAWGVPLLGEILADKAIRVRDWADVDGEPGRALKAFGNIAAANEGDVGMQLTARFEHGDAVRGQVVFRLQLCDALPNAAYGGSCCALVGRRQPQGAASPSTVK